MMSSRKTWRGAEAAQAGLWPEGGHLQSRSWGAYTCYLQLPLPLLCWVGGWQLPVPPTLLQAVLCACACGPGEGQLCVSGKCSCTPPRQLPICYEALVTIPSLRGALLQFKCAPDREKTISGANNAAQMKNVLIFEAALWQKR